MEPERWRRFQSRLLPVHVNGVGLSDVGIPIECRRFRGGKNAALLITTLDLQRYTLYASIYIYIYTRHFLDYCARTALNVPYGARYRTNRDGFIGWTGCFLDRMFDGFREKCIFFFLPSFFFFKSSRLIYLFNDASTMLL